ncbi:transposase [Streptococcus pyogenes]|nr:transposase [Streptococcus pyogenes]
MGTQTAIVDTIIKGKLDKRAAFNLNLIRKMCLYFLKVMVFPKKDLSYRRKQRYISVHLEDYLVQLFGERG